MRGKHRRFRRFEPVDVIGAVAVFAGFILAVVVVGVQLGKAVVP